MPVSKMGSKFVGGYLKFFNKSDGRITGGFNSYGYTRAVTREDQDAQNATMLVATLLNGFLVHTSVTGAGTLTLDTGANLDGITEWTIGEVLDCYYLNDGTQTVTLTGASGTTALSAQTIATLQGRVIHILKTAATTYIAWAD